MLDSRTSAKCEAKCVKGCHTRELKLRLLLEDDSVTDVASHPSVTIASSFLSPPYPVWFVVLAILAPRPLFTTVFWFVSGAINALAIDTVTNTWNLLGMVDASLGSTLLHVCLDSYEIWTPMVCWVEASEIALVCTLHGDLSNPRTGKDEESQCLRVSRKKMYRGRIFLFFLHPFIHNKQYSSLTK